MEQRPGVLDPVSLSVSSSLIIITSLGISEVDSVSHGDPGRGVIGGGPDAGVEDTAEPDHQTNDAGSVHAGGGLVSGVGDGGVPGSKHLLRQVQLTVRIRLVAHG